MDSPTAAQLAERYAPVEVSADLAFITTYTAGGRRLVEPFTATGRGSHLPMLCDTYAKACAPADQAIGRALNVLAADLARAPAFGRLVMAPSRTPRWEGPFPPLADATPTPDTDTAPAREPRNSVSPTVTG